jgi:hypothetical protein
METRIVGTKWQLVKLEKDIQLPDVRENCCLFLRVSQRVNSEMM